MMSSDIKGTGNILQDLLHSTIPIKRLKLSTVVREKFTPSQSVDNVTPPSTRRCWICSGKQQLDRFTQHEMEILQEIVLTRPYIILSSLVNSFRCQLCSSTLLKLDVLKKQIDDILICLRTVIKLKSESNSVIEDGSYDVYVKSEPIFISDSKNEDQDVGVDLLELSIVTPSAFTEQVANDPEHGIMKTTQGESRENEEKCGSSNDGWYSSVEESSDNDTSEENIKLERKKRKRSKAKGRNILKHKCDQCGKCFRDKYGLTQHLNRKRVHTKLETNKAQQLLAAASCSVCAEYFTSDQHLNNHLLGVSHLDAIKSRRLDDDGTVTFICDICDQGFILYQKLIRHKIQKHSGKVRCDPCNKEFARYDIYQSHLLTEGHRSNIGDPVEEAKGRNILKHKCDQCGKCFRDKYDLTQHLNRKRVHIKLETNKAQPLLAAASCSVCAEYFTSDQHLNNHLLGVSHLDAIKSRRLDDDGTVTFICDKCDQGFILYQKLIRHKIQKHSGKVRCDPCNKEFAKYDIYQSHLLTEGHRSNIGDPVEEARTFKCDTCQKTFFTEKLLRAHQLGHSRPIICEICGKTFARSYHLKIHQAKHNLTRKPRKQRNWLIPPEEKTFPCPLCHKRFTTSASLYRHKKSAHAKVRHKCDMCLKDFSESSTLLRHKREFHENTGTDGIAKKPRPTTQITSYPCDICPRSFVGKRNILKHIELAHCADKKRCPYDGTTLKTEEEWTGHLQVCKSSKVTLKSSCFFCGDLFQNELLRIAHHLEKHTTYACESCGKTFTRADILKAHLCGSDKSKFPCAKCGKRFRQENKCRDHMKACSDGESIKFS